MALEVALVDALDELVEALVLAVDVERDPVDPGRQPTLLAHQVHGQARTQKGRVHVGRLEHEALDRDLAVAEPVERDGLVEADAVALLGQQAREAAVDLQLTAGEAQAIDAGLRLDLHARDGIFVEAREVVLVGPETEATDGARRGRRAAGSLRARVDLGDRRRDLRVARGEPEHAEREGEIGEAAHRVRLWRHQARPL